MSKLIKCKSCGNENLKREKVCSKCGAKTKKPFYKRIWFWFIIGIIIVGSIAGGASGEGEEVVSSDSGQPKVEEKKEEKKEDKKNIIKAGTYKIGEDIPAGEYLFVAKSMGYIECKSDSTGALESIIFNDNVKGNSYLTVNDGEYLKIQGGEMYAIASAPSIAPKDGLYKDGMYKVGQDIPAGEYKVTLKGQMGYYEVTTDSRHILTSIVTNENVTGDTYLSIQEGQYLKLSGVEIQK